MTRRELARASIARKRFGVGQPKIEISLIDLTRALIDGGSILAAAKILGVSRTTLRRRMRDEIIARARARSEYAHDKQRERGAA